MFTLTFNRRKKAKPEFEKQAYVPLTKEHSPRLPSSNYGRAVSDVFNSYCHEMGVQVITTMDPKDFKRLICFKVVGNRDVQIDYQKATYVLGPGEHIDLKISHIDLDGARELPKLTLLPYGNAAVGTNRKFFQYGTLSANNDIRDLLESSLGKWNV